MSASPSPYDRIQAYYENYSSSTQFIGGDKQDESKTNLEKDVEGLHVQDKLSEATEEQKIQALRREFLNSSPFLALIVKILVFAEQHMDISDRITASLQTPGITDQVAKDSKDSNASSAPLHDVDTGASSGGNVHAAAHKANPGPVKADNLPTPESKEDLKKRAEELNK
ncbi:hypothetical protein J1614_004823 [Plenodomus biglobosus]|nr:hypothetical protein J1614_004823 [Plenodomus biglobosus]